MTGVFQCQTTAGSREEAERIGHELIRRRLAACVQTVGPVRSLYRWAGELQDDQEWLLLVKTSAERLAELEAAVAELHSYDVPEWLVVEAVGGSPGYLEWVRGQTAPPPA